MFWLFELYSEVNDKVCSHEHFITKKNNKNSQENSKIKCSERFVIHSALSEIFEINWFPFIIRLKMNFELRGFW